MYVQKINSITATTTNKLQTLIIQLGITKFVTRQIPHLTYNLTKVK